MCHCFWPGQLDKFGSLSVLFPVGQAADGRTLAFLWCASVHLENVHNTIGASPSRRFLCLETKTCLPVNIARSVQVSS